MNLTYGAQTNITNFHIWMAEELKASQNNRKETSGMHYAELEMS